jgi:hypothetical protein
MKKVAKSKARKTRTPKPRKAAADRSKTKVNKRETARTATRAKSRTKAAPRKSSPVRRAVKGKTHEARRKPGKAIVRAKGGATRRRGTVQEVKTTPKPAQSLAERVLSRRAAAAAAKTRAAPAARKGATGSGPAPSVTKTKVRGRPASRPARSGSPLYRTNREMVRVSRVPQFTYMRAPGSDSAFNVGDAVEVYCDHEQDSERVRGWIRGVVVQVDNKLVAVQFRSNVFLTDGWMVPDRILWYPLTSEQIRPLGLSRRAPRRAIPDY